MLEKEHTGKVTQSVPSIIILPFHSSSMCRVGQNHIYTVYIRYCWQGNHQIYGQIRCIYTVLANPKHVLITLATDNGSKGHLLYFNAMQEYARALLGINSGKAIWRQQSLSSHLVHAVDNI